MTRFWRAETYVFSVSKSSRTIMAQRLSSSGPGATYITSIGLINRQLIDGHSNGREDYLSLLRVLRLRSGKASNARAADL